MANPIFPPPSSDERPTASDEISIHEDNLFGAPSADQSNQSSSGDRTDDEDDEEVDEEEEDFDIEEAEQDPDPGADPADDEEGAVNEDGAQEDEEPPFDASAIGLKEISNLASFTVSSYKPGCGVKELRDDDVNQFWQYVYRAGSFQKTRDGLSWL